MESEKKAEELAAEHESRRVVPRFGVDGDARLLLVQHGSTVPCRVVDISMSGCRLRTQERFKAGTMVRVEVTFKVRGFSFRFSGSTQWTDGQNLVGIRFVDVPARRREELIEALSEVEEEHIAKAAKLAAEKQAAEEKIAAERAAKEQSAEQRVAEEKAAALRAAGVALAKLAASEALRKPQPPAQTIPAQTIALKTPSTPPVKLSKRDRREELREEVDTTAVIHLINIASRLQGRILDLSMNGCRIRTDERFPVGIYTRVEIEFRLDGLPFRLGGVIQAIHDRQMVGIRLLDMSERRREQLQQLIEDIHDSREQGISG
ncbi:MAG: PilZ domain-containing protein [Terracidiphilus sp.]|jgi:c-di-GMP-binding flagellar brake protein YcgR